MPRLNIRQFKRDVAYQNDVIAFTPAVSFTAVGGVDIATALAGGHQHTDSHVCYVDSARVDAYTETGAAPTPYKTLSAAVTAKLTNAATGFVSFRLASGNYDGVISVDKDTANQSFEIVGAGRNSTFIRGAATFASTTGTSATFLTLPSETCLFPTVYMGFTRGLVAT